MGFKTAGFPKYLVLFIVMFHCGNYSAFVLKWKEMLQKQVKQITIKSAMIY